MEICRLGAEDYRELIDLLDYVFSRKNKKEQHFEDDLPKMCVADDLHMNRHLGIRADGRLVAAVGIYPLPTVVNGTPILFSTVGNVVTHPDHEGRGYMSALMTAAMDELERIGADASRLGGSRHRYNRFGYESAGVTYKFTFTPDNLKHKFPNFKSELNVSPIEKEDTEALKYVWELYSRNAIAVNRLELPDYADVYKSICAWRCRPFLVTKGGKPVGYFSADLSDNMSEWGAENADTTCEILALWQSRVKKDFFVSVAPYQAEILKKFSVICERLIAVSPSHFKIINFEKITSALLGLKATYTELPEGEWVLEIKEYGKLKLSVKDGRTSSALTDEEASLSLDKLTATRLLFGTLPTEAVADVPSYVKAWLPLPLSWNLQDRV